MSRVGSESPTLVKTDDGDDGMAYLFLLVEREADDAGLVSLEDALAGG